ncbi:MAG TPA: hypothetical protein VD837_07670 [Terriglobales bacterium]|nr:hypothetical protein [Terriglobales bacterium]
MKIKGIASLVIAVVAVVGLVLWIPALKWFLLGAFILGVGITFILRAWYARRPVKGPDEGVRLHLND